MEVERVIGQMKSGKECRIIRTAGQVREEDDEDL